MSSPTFSEVYTRLSRLVALSKAIDQQDDAASFPTFLYEGGRTIFVLALSPKRMGNRPIHGEQIVTQLEEVEAELMKSVSDRTWNDLPENRELAELPAGLRQELDQH
ncbi:MAG: hypothetical protein KGJ39_04050 [Acidobacteriota bacterium]|nr:hypothetical protein [Acidobacteriota bacterium]